MAERQQGTDAAVAAALRPGSFPQGLTPEVEDLWTAVTALEGVVHGRIAPDGSGRPQLPAADRRELRRLTARLAVLGVLAGA